MKCPGKHTLSAFEKRLFIGCTSPKANALDMELFLYQEQKLSDATRDPFLLIHIRLTCCLPCLSRIGYVFMSMSTDGRQWDGARILHEKQYHEHNG